MPGPPGHRRGPRSPRGRVRGAAEIRAEPVFDLSFQRLFQVPAGKLPPRPDERVGRLLLHISGDMRARAVAEESGWKVAFCVYVDSPQTAIVTDVRNDSWFSAEQ